MKRIRNAGIAAITLIAGSGVAAGVHTYAAGSSAPALATARVEATTVNNNFAFRPKKITIHVGTKVVWTNPSPAPHTVTGKGSWTVNKSLPTGKRVSMTFKKAGTYKYYCAIHPYMVGTIVVKK